MSGGPIIYGTVCSGIGAPEYAWGPLGWESAFASEIAAFPRQVFAHHFPETPLHGDFTTIRPGDYRPIDLLVGGTPCQSFSVAGGRGGMDDLRGNLALEYIRLADRLRPRWLAWENVPGVFSSNGGDDFRCFLSGLVRWSVPIPDGGWQNSGVIAPGPVDGAFGVAWRVLDAQFIRTQQHPRAVPQRRRRVLVVGYIGDWRRAAAVLLEPSCLSGDRPPERRAGQDAGPRTGPGPARGDGRLEDVWPAEVAGTLDTAYATKFGLEDQHLYSQKGSKFVLSFAMRGREEGSVPEVHGDGQTAGTLRSASGGSTAPHLVEEINGRLRIRRLTPREGERLQGFPDDWTLVGKAADSARHAAVGNSMPIPVMRWLGERIAEVDRIA